LRIATWNVNGLRARFDFVAHWLRERQPDVVGLQELKLTDEQFPVDEFASLGYQAVFHGQKSWNGVAILSREPATVTQTGLPAQDSMGARLLSADVAGLSFTTVYCPNGKSVDHEDYGRKLAWIDDLTRYADEAKLADRPAILCGDFNVCRSALDSWGGERFEGHIFHTDAERERLERLLALGFVDAFREKYPNDATFSWWDYRGGAFHKKQGLRIDLILVTAPAMARIEKVEVDREYRKKQDGLTASDHAPVIAELA
jgi:exodeoxyribonuclease-3